MVFYFAKHVAPIFVIAQLKSYTDYNLTGYTPLQWEDRILTSLEVAYGIDFIAFVLYFLMSIRKGKGFTNTTRRYLFVAMFVINSLVIPLAVIAICSWAIIDASKVPKGKFFNLPFIYVTICFELLKTIFMLLQFDFKDVPMKSLEKKFFTWKRWKQFIFQSEGSQEEHENYDKAENLAKMKSFTWTTKQKHAELENFILPMKRKSESYLVLDESIYSLAFIAALNLDAERSPIAHKPFSLTDKNEQGESS